MPLPPAPRKKADLLQAKTTASKSTSTPAGKKIKSTVVLDLLTKPEIDLKAAVERVTPVTAKQTETTKTPTHIAADTGHDVTQADPGAIPKKKSSVQKLFVLDTNVLMHDPMCLFRFEEHDIFLPMIVLEELDSHKKGMTEVARNARQTSRTLDALVGISNSDISKGLELSATGNKEVGGKLFFQTIPLSFDLPASLPQGKADNQILGVVKALGDVYPKRQVVLVSKDINMRVKARALGLHAEDYQNDKTLEDGDLLYSGALALSQDFWSKQAKTVESWQSAGYTYYRISGADQPVCLF
jgi:PhoH-like ATPase